jgi:hypothetical protein
MSDNNMTTPQRQLAFLIKPSPYPLRLRTRILIKLTQITDSKVLMWKHNSVKQNGSTPQFDLIFTDHRPSPLKFFRLILYYNVIVINSVTYKNLQ